MTDHATDRTGEEPHLSLSLEEVAALCRLLGLTPPPPIAEAVAREAGAGTVDSLSIAGRALLARGMVRRTADDEFLVADDVRLLIELLCRPALVTQVEVEHDDCLTVHTVYAAPDSAVLQTADGTGVLNFTPLGVAAVPGLVVVASTLDDRPAVQVPDFSVPVRTLSQAGEALDRGDVESAVSLLRAAGGVEAAVRAYAEALAQHRIGSRVVTIVHRRDDVSTYTVVAWTDCGKAGLWQVEQDELTDALASGSLGADVGDEALDLPMTVGSRSGEGLLAQIEAGFPWGIASA